jgi:hypothetical protein
MFQVFYGGTLIGKSALEEGDPPMGCAEGCFIPLDEFGSFHATVSPAPDNDVAIKRWVGLSIATLDGAPIECLDVVLFEYDFGEQKELRVDAVGIGYPLYEELFPGRYAAYEASFAQKTD